MLKRRGLRETNGLRAEPWLGSSLSPRLRLGLYLGSLGMGSGMLLHLGLGLWLCSGSMGDLDWGRECHWGSGEDCVRGLHLWLWNGCDWDLWRGLDLHKKHRSKPLRRPPLAFYTVLEIYCVVANLFASFQQIAQRLLLSSDSSSSTSG